MDPREIGWHFQRGERTNTRELTLDWAGHRELLGDGRIVGVVSNPRQHRAFKRREFHTDNEKVEQLAANRLTISQDAIASLLQRLVRFFPTSGSETAPRSNLKEHLGATESDIKFLEEVGLTEDHWDAIALAPGKGKSDRRESLDLHKKDQTARF